MTVGTWPRPSTSGSPTTPSTRSDDLAGAFRLPHAVIANGANLPHLDHFEARQAFSTGPHRDGSFSRGRPAGCTRPGCARPNRHRASAPTGPAPPSVRRPPSTRQGCRRRRPRPALRRLAGPRHDRLLGRAGVHPCAGHARRRGHPSGVDHPAGRDAHARRPHDRRAVVGTFAHLLGDQHQQEEPDARLPRPRRAWTCCAG